jgi:hypothetical protein
MNGHCLLHEHPPLPPPGTTPRPDVSLPADVTPQQEPPTSPGPVASGDQAAPPSRHGQDTPAPLSTEAAAAATADRVAPEAAAAKRLAVLIASRSGGAKAAPAAPAKVPAEQAAALAKAFASQVDAFLARHKGLLDKEGRKGARGGRGVAVKEEDERDVEDEQEGGSAAEAGASVQALELERTSGSRAIC